MPDHARELRFYLPPSYGDRVQIRGTFTAYEWRDMIPPTEPSAEWTYAAPDIELGDVYSFRYRLASDGSWVEATDPLARRYSQRFHQETKRYDLEAIVTGRPSSVPAPPPRPTQGLRICECTLPGLAARWLPPGSLAQSASTTGPSLAARLVGAELGEELRRRGYSAVMLPLQASAADTEHYNWKFGYLVTGLGAIHQSFGDWDEMRALVAEFHAEGVLVIPDLILVHYADQTSDRAPYAIRDAEGQMLWFDHSANRPVDFGTYMLRWEDDFVRRSVAKLLARFVAELGLAAFRFDFVDGVVRQYESRGQNFGAQLLDDCRREFAAQGLDAWSICESFATREHPSVLGFADILYQPWVGFDCMKAALTTPDEGTAWRFDKVRQGLVGATGSRQPKPTLGYALAHDEAGRDEVVLNNHRNDRGETVSVGGHMAQLVVDYLQRLPDWLKPPAEQWLTFVADRVALLEGTALFGADFAHMSLGGFSDWLKLGSYDDPDGWQMVWHAEGHPDLEKWCELSAQPPEGVTRQLAAHSARMTRLRELFAEHTPIEASPPRSRIDIEPLASAGGPATLAWLRRGPREARGEAGGDLLVLAQFANGGAERFDLTLPTELAGEWEVAASSIDPAKGPQVGEKFACGADGRIALEVAGNTLVILRRVARAAKG